MEKMTRKTRYANLGVKFLGFDLKNPLIAESAGYAVSEWGIKRLLRAGCSAVVTKSTTWDPLGNYPRRWDGTIQPRCYWVYDDGMTTLDGSEALQNPGYLNMAQFIRANRTVAEEEGAFIIGSFSPRSPEEGAIMAREFEKAGAAALHMDMICATAASFRNLQYPGKGYTHLGEYWSEDPERIVSVLKAVRDAVDIPLIPKTRLQRWLTTDPDVISNGYGKYLEGYAFDTAIPTLDMDLYTGKRVYAKISGKAMRYNLFQVLARMYRLGTGKTLMPSGGLHFGEDVIKCIMLGADGVGICSALYRGTHVVDEMLDYIEEYMVGQAIDSLDQIKGTGFKDFPPEGFPKLRRSLELQAKELGKEFTGEIPGANPPAPSNP
ncbi:hypothetical protein CL673_09090 [Candidatus Bathyarchaeota archaeon]|nr:hypothetical protein [Candidatus Bathyarchaeota archaeon]|tara:strand:+ start:399 stop:1532 length:1134 start_codon:yes stop_codon:yes gene_type:complete